MINWGKLFDASPSNFPIIIISDIIGGRRDKLLFDLSEVRDGINLET